ncbi:hypothetical protein MKW92_014485 [Papaver armeniacum]|nr:hypothetical protein MKW92_014485 [Papaver armeniacum]
MKDGIFTSHYCDRLNHHRGDEKPEEAELPKYRDRAKERREDQNPDYEASELGSFHAVAPPGAVDLRPEEAMKISIENSKYLGGNLWAAVSLKLMFPFMLDFIRHKWVGNLLERLNVSKRST